MKKILIVTLICLCVLPVFAQERTMGVHNRTIEFGLVNLNIGYANNFLSLNDVFQEKIVIDLDKLSKGFSSQFGVSVYPMYFNYNNNKGWGFGVFTGFEGYGYLDLAGEMLSFSSEADEVKSDIGMAVFAETGAHAYFSIGKLKLKVRSSLYIPLLYASPEISYTNKADGGNMELNLGFNMKIYTPFNMRHFEMANLSDSSMSVPNNVSLMDELTATPGLDLNVGFEYPLSRALGMSGFWKIFDFDIGADAYHIPLIPSVMHDYMVITGNIGTNGSVNLFDVDLSKLVEISEIGYGQESIAVQRPFKTLAWLRWRPLFGANLLSVKPFFGFSINPLYVVPLSMEYGMNVNLNFANLLIVTAGVGFEDRMWRESLEFAINLRAFELDLGVDMRSQDFIQSWYAGGIGVRVGLKFGW